MSSQAHPATTTEWWQSADAQPELEACLNKLNESEMQTDVVSRFSLILQGMNVLWSGKNRLDNERGRSDNQSFRQLLYGIPEPRQTYLCSHPEIEAFANFTPRILNLDCLRNSSDYIPNRPIPATLQNQSSREHRHLSEAVQAWKQANSEENRLLVLNKLAALLYVVRSNIAHGEKTIHGPDFGKATRDRQVCEVSIPAAKTLVEALVDYPSERLVSYGTLSPSGPNARVLEPVSRQNWRDCEIVGLITESGGLKYFEWRKADTRHSAKLLTSPKLPEHWAALDKFEGKEYKRSLITAIVGGEHTVAIVYQKS